MTRRYSRGLRRQAIAVWRTPYFLPSPSASEDDYRRFFHLDLEGMSPDRLWAECERARAALAEVRVGDDPIIVYGNGLSLRASSWLRERVERTGGLPS